MLKSGIHRIIRESNVTPPTTSSFIVPKLQNVSISNHYILLFVCIVVSLIVVKHNKCCYFWPFLFFLGVFIICRSVRLYSDWCFSSIKKKNDDGNFRDFCFFLLSLTFTFVGENFSHRFLFAFVSSEKLVSALISLPPPLLSALPID